MVKVTDYNILNTPFILLIFQSL